MQKSGVIFQCYVTLRYITLCYVTLRYVMLRYVTLRQISVQLLSKYKVSTLGTGRLDEVCFAAILFVHDPCVTIFPVIWSGTGLAVHVELLSELVFYDTSKHQARGFAILQKKCTNAPTVSRWEPSSIFLFFRAFNLDASPYSSIETFSLFIANSSVM